MMIIYGVEHVIAMYCDAILKSESICCLKISILKIVYFKTKWPLQMKEHNRKWLLGRFLTCLISYWTELKDRDSPLCPVQ
jgi:hypothetical protein